MSLNTDIRPWYNNFVCLSVCLSVHYTLVIIVNGLNKITVRSTKALVITEIIVQLKAASGDVRITVLDYFLL